MSKELEEIKKLKEERELVGMKVKNIRSGKIGIVLHQWESGSVAVLESINPTIINTHDNWKTLEIVTDDIQHKKQLESEEWTKRKYAQKILNLLKGEKE